MCEIRDLTPASIEKAISFLYEAVGKRRRKTVLDAETLNALECILYEGIRTVVTQADNPRHLTQSSISAIVTVRRIKERLQKICR